MQSGFLLFVFLTLLCICHGNEKCQQIHNVTDSELAARPKNENLESLPLKLKCYIKCLMDDILGVDGKIDMRRVYEVETTNARRTKVANCKVQNDLFVITNDADACDYAVKVLKCLRSPK